MAALQRRRGNKFLRFGAPLVAMVVLGYGGMAHLLQGRRELQQAKDDEDWANLHATRALSKEGPLQGATPRPKLNLEEELKNLKEKVNIDDFEYKPVPKLKSSSK